MAEIISVMKESVDVWVYQYADWFITNSDGPHVEKETNTVQFDPKVVDLLDGPTDAVERSSVSATTTTS